MEAFCHDDGAFGQYATAIGDLQIKIPENISFEEAATLGVGVTARVILIPFGF